MKTWVQGIIFVIIFVLVLLLPGIKKSYQAAKRVGPYPAAIAHH